MTVHSGIFNDESGVRTALDTEEESLIVFCKQMLKTRLFQGFYQERRYVDSLKCYRDLIVVDNCESELKGDLKYIHHKLTNFYRDNSRWMGITLTDMIGAPAGTCIWSEVENTAFGKYWFQIKTIRFRQNEIYIKVKPLRLVEDNRRVQTETRPGHCNTAAEGISLENIYSLLLQWNQSISASIMSFLANDINKENIFAFLRFLALLLISIFAGSVEFVKQLGIFSLRLFAETRLFLYTATPIIFKMLDLLSKVIGGIFIFLAMVWRDLICGIRGKSLVPERKALSSSVRGYRQITDRPFEPARKRYF